VLIYLAIYLVMTIGTFACILAMRRADGPIEDISSLAGLAQTNLPMAAALAILMFSLAGIPPLAGFFAKIYVFYPAMKAGGGLTYLAVLAVIASVIGAYYYLRIVKIMFFDEPVEKFEVIPLRISAVMAVSAFLIVAFVAWPGPLVDAAQAAVAGFFQH
jgi:NADH-quinone oxidoreductase subunit N